MKFILGDDGVFREVVRDKVHDAILGALNGVADFVSEVSYSVALIGAGLCILFTVVGWEGGKKWVGVILLGYVLVRLLLGV